MGKILSSREEPTGVELLQELVFLTHDALGRSEDPAEELTDLMGQLETSVVDMCIKLDDQDTKISMLSMDLIQVSLRNAAIMSDLRAALRVLEVLGRPVNTKDESFTKALTVVRREGDPDVLVQSGQIDVTLAFEEDKLTEAFKLGIEEYINRTAAAAIRG